MIRNNVPQPIAAVWFAIVLAALSLAAPMALANGGTDITVVTTVSIDEINAADDIWLAGLTTQSGDDEGPVIGLKWTKKLFGWLPTWALEVTGTTDLLQSSSSFVDGNESDMTSIELAKTSPTAGHTYEVTISYSPSLGALAVKVYDRTAQRVVIADAIAVGAHPGNLVALAGQSLPHYVPVGTTWAPGTGHDGQRFLATRLFETREQTAVVQLMSPLPTPPGEYRIIAQHADEEAELARLTMTSEQVRIPLNLNALPLGPSTLRLDYIYDDETVFSETTMISIGRVDVWMEPVVTERDDGTLHTSLSLLPAGSLDERVNIDVKAELWQLVWDGEERGFNEVLYATDIPLYRGAVDLAADVTSLPLQLDLPDEQSNWRVRIVPELDPPVRSEVSGNERLFSTYSPAEIGTDEPYTIVVFPDTQYFVQDYPHVFTRMTDWVAAHTDELNIAAVLHVGDITNNDTQPQWERAFESMSLLHDVVPYVLTLGNHDMTRGQGGRVSQRGLSLINHYFKPENAKRYSNLGGTMYENSLENSYSLFTIGDTNYLVIALEFFPPDEALTWANGVAAQYPDHKMILLTHSYTAKSGNLAMGSGNYALETNPDTTVNYGLGMWQKLVSKQKNSFIVLSGHTSPPSTVPYRVARNDFGNFVYEMLFDYQVQDFGGNGWLGLLTFYPDDTMEVRLYSPFLGTYANARDGHGFTSHFTIDLNKGTVQHGERIFREAS